MQLGARDASKVPKPCHRLDLETSGVLLYAKTSAAATALMTQFEQRAVNKTYCALCTNPPTAEAIDAPICKVENAEQAVRRTCDPGEAGGLAARSTVSIIGVADEPDADGDDAHGRALGRACLVLVKPHHGRTHQVRVHCAALGAPLVGDGLYGGEAAVRTAKRASMTRHALHALSIEIRHPTSGRRMSISAPLPTDMRKAASALQVQSGAKLAEGRK